MSDEPKPPLPPADDEPTILDLIDWIFFAGAPIGEEKAEEGEGEGEEDLSQTDEL